MQGHDFDLKAWELKLRPPFDPVIEVWPRASGNEFLLKSTLFEALEEPADVWALGQQLIAQLNGAMFVSDGAEPLVAGPLYRSRASGSVDTYVFVAGVARGRSMAFGHAVAVTADGQIKVETPAPSNPQAWMGSAAQNPVAQDMLVHAARADNWYDLYKAIEYAEALLGGQHRLLKFLGSESVRAKQTRTQANYHRHARTSKTPKPQVEVTLDDARETLRMIVRNVLASLP